MGTLNPARVAREFPNRYRLEATRCTGCGEVVFPARLVCPSCRGRNFEPLLLRPEGKVVTFTVIHVAPSAFRHDAPYVLAIVELEQGARLTCQVADVALDQVKTGMPVRLEFRRIQEDGEAGVIAYGHKAVPA
ncbi:MAG: Zn-ribbon domain-containing OB-fold protein [Thermoanaerobaculales bacterium]